MQYKLTEIFNSIQGEGSLTGLPCIFVRFSGCNKRCIFCDTNYETRLIYSEAELYTQIVEVSSGIRDVVFTGGEPLLQDLEPIINLLKGSGFILHLETNGTIPTDYSIWETISLSPKVPSVNCKVQKATSLKILFPYINEKISIEGYKNFPASHKFLQPIDTGCKEKNHEVLQKSVDEIKSVGKGWRLGVQLHKYLNLQ